MVISTEDVLASRYKLIRLLSKSPLGTSYLAVDLSLDGAKVMVTLLPDTIRGSERAIRRVRTALINSLKLLHTNIASIRALEENGGRPFFVMDYIEGLTLDKSLDTWHTLSEGETKTLLEPIAEAIDYAHEKGVIHEDIRPENIIISEDLKPSITGFSTSLAVRESVAWTLGGSACGCVGYLSPEQLMGEAPSEKTDIYSFAAIAYECMMGHPPFFRGQIEYQVVNTAPAPIPSDTPFTRAVMKALSKDAAQRPEKCIDVILGYTPPIELPPEPVQEKTHGVLQSKKTGKSLERKPEDVKSDDKDLLERGAAMKKMFVGHLKRRNRKDNDEFDDESPDLLFRMKTEPAMQAATLGIVILIIIVSVIFASNSPIFNTNKMLSERTALVNKAVYDKFHEIDFTKIYTEVPLKGGRTDFGMVESLSPYGNSVTVKLDKPVFKIFSDVKVAFVKVHEGYKIRSLIFNKDGSGQDPVKVKMAAAKIAQLLGNYFGIDMGETQSNKNETYFSNKYHDGIVDIKISCAVSKESTNFLLSMERMQ